MDNTKMKEFLGIIKNSIVDTNLLINKIWNDSIKDKQNYCKAKEKKLKYDMGFVCLKSWFTRCSDYIKFRFFRILFSATPVDVLIEIYYTYYSYSMKDSIYEAYCQKPVIRHCKNYVSDKNPYLDAGSLNRVIMYDFVWYKHLDSFEKHTLLIDLLQLCKTTLKREIMKKLIDVLTVYEDSKPKPIEESAATGKKGKKDKLEKKEKKKDKKRKKDKRGKKDVVEHQPEPEPERDVKKEYQEWLQKKFKTSSSLERLNNEVEQAHKRWDDEISRYRAQLGEEIDDEGGKKKKKKSPKKKKGKKGAEVLDQIQMLPIWVNKTIITEIDPKSKKKLNVNKYLKFLSKNVGQDQKCRLTLNKTIQKMGIDIRKQDGNEGEQFNFTLRRKYKEKIFDDIPSVKKDTIIKSTYHNTSILSDVLIQNKDTFRFPVDLKECFPRRV